MSKPKLQFVLQEVKYLGHLIGHGTKKLSAERIEGILNLRPPTSKREIWQLLGLFGYCRLWIDQYSQPAKFLYEKLMEEEPFNWDNSDTQKLQNLREINKSTRFKPPFARKTLRSICKCGEGNCLRRLEPGVGWSQEVAFLSKLLDPVSRGWPVCIQSIAAAAVLVSESQNLIFGGDLTVHTPHSIKTMLAHRAAE